MCTIHQVIMKLFLIEELLDCQIDIVAVLFLFDTNHVTC